ncbi:MAG: hypothetical protein ACTHN5_08535, partial [Phycisphaerae bacterium]
PPHPPRLLSAPPSTRYRGRPATAPSPPQAKGLAAPRVFPFHRPAALAALLLATPLARASTPHSHSKSKPTPAAENAEHPKNPLLPPQIPLESLYPDLALTQKNPDTFPDLGSAFQPLYTEEDFQTYRTRFAADADTLARKKSSALIEFSQKLIAAANEPNTPAGLQRLLLLRAAIDCYRTRGGYETANKAVQQFLSIIDLHSPAQVAALWTIANAMSRTITTPKPDRIHYSAIAARANMQLTILLLNNDQLDAAQSLQNLVRYHEGWLHTSGASPADKVAYTQIPKVRALVRQTQTTMDYLATQYQPAINGDDNALMAIYLYGRYVKQKPAIVADLPSRKPNSPLAALAAALDAVDRKSDPEAPYTAAETLKAVAANLPDGVLKQRTLYAALQNYRLFIADPRTERDRVKRTLARMATEAVISDGAHGPSPVVNPFAPPTPPATQPAAPTTTQPAPEEETLGESPQLRPPTGHEVNPPPSPTTGPQRARPTPATTPSSTPLPASTPSMPPL